jgi:hypothetical protein
MLEDEFEDFIAIGILDAEDNDFQGYEICITEFDMKLAGDKLI